MKRLHGRRGRRASDLALTLSVLGVMILGAVGLEANQGPAPEIARLREEVRSKGWIAFSARSETGDWDLFVSRPDGSELRNITRTPEFHEAAPQFSRDGKRLLYRRLAKDEVIDPNHYGSQGELMLANSDGSEARSAGRPGEYPWACWNPDGQEVACLSIKGVSVIDLAAGKVLRTLGRKGFFQQLSWSPDGQWFTGVANSYGTGWSIARMNATSGEAGAVNRVDCCTPDWFPDSRSIIFSWRPPGQKTNKGYGWTQLWLADLEGKSRQLVYGEDGRHVYGGHVSPDGRYVVFTGNMEENGDPKRSGAPMGLMRLTDAPIIGGASPDLRALHPAANNGPVLPLPQGWEPTWTFSELTRGGASGAGAKADVSSSAGADFEPGSAPGDATAQLRQELRGKGWIVFSAQTETKDWDLVACRPDGSGMRQLTRTPDFTEAGARFSPDGGRLLYYRMPKEEPLDNNTYGTFDLVMARSDGSRAVVYGPGFSWASWGPDSSQIVCLAKKAIQIVEVASRRVVKELPRRNLVQQLSWSPDGQWITGTANGLGPFWNIGRLDAQTGVINAVSETERYNCTPDWCPDSQTVIYARGIIPQEGGQAELWSASGDGRERRMLYAEEDRHIYGAATSPDGQYLLFTRSEEDLGKVDNSKTRLAIIRRREAPMAFGQGGAPHKKYAAVEAGTRLDLTLGWEPHWTYAELFKTDTTSTNTTNTAQAGQ